MTEKSGKSAFKRILILFLIAIPLITSAISFIIIDVLSSEYYAEIERLEIHYPDSDIPVISNFYYPAKIYGSNGIHSGSEENLTEKPPVLIYMTGFEAQKDMDIRPPIEFCKRGFAVLTMELRGHGEMPPYFGPEIINDIRALVNYTYDNLGDRVDLSRVALLGHSAGGMAVLGVLDPRVNATVSWAGPPYISGKIFDLYKDQFKYYNPTIDVYEALESFNSSAPYLYINEDLPRNLLVIHHVDDGIVEFELSQKIKEKTNCTLITITYNDTTVYPILQNIKDGHFAHLLLYDKVMSESINWIETKLDYHPPSLKQPYTNDANGYKLYFVVILLWLISFFFCIPSIILIYAIGIKSHREKSATSGYTGENIPDKADKGSERKGGNSYLSAVYLSIFLVSYIILGLSIDKSARFRVGIIPELTIPGSIVIITAFIIKLKERLKEKKPLDISAISANIGMFIAGLLIAAIFWGYYFLFSFRYKFMVIYPLKLSDFLNALIRIAPFVFGRAIFYSIWYKEKSIAYISKFSAKYFNIISAAIYTGLSAMLFINAPSVVILQLSLLIFIIGSIYGALIFKYTQNPWIVSGMELLLFSYIFAKCYLFF